MRKFVVLTILLVMASLLAACDSGLSEEQVSEIAAQAAKEAVEAIEFPKQEPVVVEVVMPEVPEVEEPELEPVVAPVVSNTLVNPVLFDAGEHPAGESTPGFFDIGINPGQLGLVFGWDLNWNGNSISGEGCEIVVLPVGWYENFSIVDGRYEVYTLPSADPAGWTQVLVDQRVAEQAEHYGCPADKVPPVWEGGE
jgi:hypothetical protein